MKSVRKLFKIKNNTFTIFCDMDGVLTDFDGAAKYLDSNIFNLPQEEMWKKIEQTGVEFWSRMNWIQGGKELWDYLTNHDPRLLTALPGLSDDDPNRHNAIEGKKKWVSENLGDNHLERLIMTTSPEKEKYATSKSILIDDRKDLVDGWKRKGGIGIVHKDPNNTIHELKEFIVR